MNNPPIIGYAGMTHLGLVSSVAAAEKNFSTICFDFDIKLIEDIKSGHPPNSEPMLVELLGKNKNKLTFTSDIRELCKCDIVYISLDVPTDNLGNSNLLAVDEMLSQIFSVIEPNSILVLLSQVPPGFTRSKLRSKYTLLYQVETLVFGDAVNRALFPERFIVGCDDPSHSLPKIYEDFLSAFHCPIISMGFESAELSKISINMFLVAQIATANTLAELCERNGANWSEIIPALKLDKRIGKYSYLKPGLGISGGNLERDLATIKRLGMHFGTDIGVINAWISNSQHRKGWPFKVLNDQLLSLDRAKKFTVAILGLAYKENTNSVKNSPAIELIEKIGDLANIMVYDPVVKFEKFYNAKIRECHSAIKAVENADALVIMTPWEEFRTLDLSTVASKMAGNLVIDPYGMIPKGCNEIHQFKLYSLGKKNLNTMQEEGNGS